MSRLRCALALLCGLMLVAAACGGSDEPAELDLAKAEREIRRLSERAYGEEAEVGAVKCPPRVEQRKGGQFTCTVDIDDQPLVIAVRQKDDRGNVRIDQIQAVIFTAKVERFVASYASENGRPVSAVACGETTVSTRSPGERFSCSVTFEDGTTGTARLQVKDTNGKVGLQSLKET